ncbi:TolC family protein [Membranihabitans marinus]
MGIVTAQNSFNLSEAMDYALQHQIEIQKARLNIEDADYQIKEILALAIPTLKGNVDYQRYLQLPTQIIPQGAFFAGDQNNPPNPAEDIGVQFGVNNSLTAGLSFNALLFDGSVFVGIQASRLARSLANSQIDVVERDIRENVIKSYLAILIADHMSEIIDLNIKNLEQTYFETNEMYKSGFLEKLDVDRLKYSISNLEMEAENNENMIYAAKNILKLQMGYPMDEEIEVSEKLEDYIQVDEAVNLLSETYSFQNRPEYETLSITEDLREMDVKQLRFGYLPTLSFFANYNQQLQANKLKDGLWFPYSIVGGSLAIPIFDGRDRAMKIERANVRLKLHQLDMENIERSMQVEVDNAKRDLSSALNRIDDSKNNMTLADDIYKVTQIKYKEGVGSSVELSQAESALYQAQSKYINALYDFSVAKANLEKALGKL